MSNTMNTEVPMVEKFLQTKIAEYKTQHPVMAKLGGKPDDETLCKWLKQFAFLHVKAALQTASDQAKVRQKCCKYHTGETVWEDVSQEVFVTVQNENSYDEHHCMTVDSESILNSYTDENIK